MIRYGNPARLLRVQQRVLQQDGVITPRQFAERFGRITQPIGQPVLRCRGIGFGRRRRGSRRVEIPPLAQQSDRPRAVWSRGPVVRLPPSPLFLLRSSLSSSL